MRVDDRQLIGMLDSPYVNLDPAFSIPTVQSFKLFQGFDFVIIGLKPMGNPINFLPL